MKKEIQSWIVVILVVLAIKATFVEAMVIPTPSMENILMIGDALMVNRFVYGVKIPIPFTNRQVPLIPGQKPRRGDIVAFLSPMESKNLVKRCVAVEGDTVQVIDKAIYVNGRKMVEPYARHLDPVVQPGVFIGPESYQVNWESGDLYKLFGLRLRDNFGPVVVPRDHFFMMGDNRDNSFDSRFWGPLHKKYLLGKPLFIFLSIDPGGPAENLLQLLRVWRWKGIRPNRIGKVIY